MMTITENTDNIHAPALILSKPYPKIIESFNDAVYAIANLCKDCPHTTNCNKKMKKECNYIREKIRLFSIDAFNIAKPEETLYIITGTRCVRNCQKCPVKNETFIDLDEPIDFTSYSVVTIAGGEPTQNSYLITELIREIRQANESAYITLSTHIINPNLLLAFAPLVDGITITLHSHYDILPLYEFDTLLEERPHHKRLILKLNLCKRVTDKHVTNVDPTCLKCDWTITTLKSEIDACKFPNKGISMCYDK